MKLEIELTKEAEGIFKELGIHGNAEAMKTFVNETIEGVDVTGFIEGEYIAELIKKVFSLN